MRLALLIALSLLLSAPVYAFVSIDRVEIEGQEVWPWDVVRLSIDRGQEIDVEVRLTAWEDVRNVELRAFLSGHEWGDIDDRTEVWDARANTTYIKRLQLQLDSDVELDEYNLRLIVADRTEVFSTAEYGIRIDAPKHAVRIKDILLTPGSSVRQGEALIVKVRAENLGARDQKAVKVTAAIPQLGLEAVDYIDEIESSSTSEEAETEEMLLKIPKTAEPGSYELKITLEYAKGRKKVTESRTITVIEVPKPKAEEPEPEPVVSAGSVLGSTEAGQTIVWPITVTNPAKTQKSIAIAVAGPGDIELKIAPTASTVIKPGRSTTFFVYATPTKAGTALLTATISSGTEVVDQVSFALTTESAALETRTVLEIVLIALIVLLVVIALIIGISKLKQ